MQRSGAQSILLVFRTIVVCCQLILFTLHTFQGEHYGYLDIGGAYIGATQRHLLRVLKELGLEKQLYCVYYEDRSVFTILVCCGCALMITFSSLQCSDRQIARQ
ncbi:hypothetical protein HPB48_017015 [Haemaphysalis longicornis]|uniref:Uncharacterized protein n=1 Tax=Haemaphysalis longicornis TaxID=44386 RepID=A0A9J6G072_HAELO|nr:hypothetical protein HPB48_017015 [Haemaphysalis longicornis]